jgi:SAM-dependent methyltransferase
MLHVAPDLCLAQRIRTLPNVKYLSADLDPTKAMVGLDLTSSTLPDGSFDVIHVSHVLEHIPDDGAAMRELHRMLAPGGLAVLAVPVWGDTTREDLTVTDPDERARLYGQPDHVRMYGRDGVFADRLQTAGFRVTDDPLIREMEPAQRRRYRVLAHEPIFACRRSTPPPEERRSAWATTRARFSSRMKDRQSRHVYRPDADVLADGAAH